MWFVYSMQIHWKCCISNDITIHQYRNVCTDWPKVPVSDYHHHHTLCCSKTHVSVAKSCNFSPFNSDKSNAQKLDEENRINNHEIVYVSLYLCLCVLLQSDTRSKTIDVHPSTLNLPDSL